MPSDTMAHLMAETEVARLACEVSMERIRQGRDRLIERYQVPVDPSFDVTNALLLLRILEKADV